MLSYIKLHNLKKVISCKEELSIIPALFYLLKLQQNIEKLKFGQYYADSPALLKMEDGTSLNPLNKDSAFADQLGEYRDRIVK